jgi:integrase
VATCNHYLTAAKGFARWLARGRRIPADPLSHLERLNPDVDVRRQRRALREETFARFIEATAAGRPFRGLTGPDRLVIYTLAANTGFRASELASLTPASFAFDASPPTVTVGAAYSKRKRKDVQPLRPDVAELIRQYVAGRPARSPIWPGAWSADGAELLQVDLAAAGIPFEDEDGRVFDFHALRGQFISQLAAKGVHPKVAQVLARHSTITLTMDYYTHLDVLDVGGALDKLPELPKVQGACKAPTGRRLA